MNQSFGTKSTCRIQKNCKKLISWRVVNSDNTSFKMSSSNPCSTNWTPSKDGGTCMRKSNETKNKMHNLIIECEKVRIKNSSLDGLPILIELCKINKWSKKVK